jgi:hypothetical protein
MAKKDKKKKDRKGSDAAEAVEAVRSAVERTFQATTEGAAGTQKRTRALLDEIGHAAARVRESLEDVRGLRGELEALARRVTALEGRGAKPASTTSAKAKRRPAKRASTAKRAATVKRPAKSTKRPATAKRASTAKAKAKSSARAKAAPAKPASS